MLPRIGVVMAGALALLAPSDAMAGAPPGCAYDELPDHVLYVGGEPDGGFHLGVQGDEIVVTHISGASQPITCVGQTPTTSNVDTIQVLTGGGENHQLQIANPPAFAPGFTGEVIPPSEIEFEISLGGGLGDRLIFIVGESNLKIGHTGIDWNPGSPFVKDADVTFYGGVDRIGVTASAQNSTASGRGGDYLGGPVFLPLDYVGGSGRDVVFGGHGPDELDGGSGRDVLRGEEGNDLIFGGPGRRDRLYGEKGLDDLLAVDGKRDKAIDCGPGDNGDESAERDKGKDPKPRSC